MPFVQGHLRHESLTVTFASECAHCGHPLRIEIDSNLSYHVDPAAAGALIFVPMVDFAKLRAKSIIDDF
ncbi:MAG: hypothetical protein ACHQ9S_00490 [Candidatus Binatia bacterium]